MSSLWTDLLFLHGHLIDWRLAQRLSRAAAPQDPSPAAVSAPDQHPGHPRRDMLTLRLCLGIGGGELHRQ